jgi:EAL domain-containing protein (putative c-di-GMP-specific phosphodiesterase class I)
MTPGNEHFIEIGYHLLPDREREFLAVWQALVDRISTLSGHPATLLQRSNKRRYVALLPSEALAFGYPNDAYTDYLLQELIENCEDITIDNLTLRAIEDRDRSTVESFGDTVAEYGKRIAADEEWNKLARLDEIIRTEAFHVEFQPVIDLMDGSIYMVEALSRFQSRTPGEWFDEARELGLIHKLEILAIRKALRAAHVVPGDALVSVNVSPDTLTSQAFTRLLEHTRFPLHRLVLEVTEHAFIDDFERVLKMMQRLRAKGVKVALDDLGAGYASLRHLVGLAPDIIKVDRSLIRDIHEGGSQHALLRALVSFASTVDAVLVTEGIESNAELAVVRSTGARYGQGFLLSNPAAVPHPADHLNGVRPVSRLPAWDDDFDLNPIA